MAHLIKLEDYQSRYQFDLNRYPSQFSRLKKERWYYLKNEWEQVQQLEEVKDIKVEVEQTEQGNFFSKLLQQFQRKKVEEETMDAAPLLSEEQRKLKNMSIEQLKRTFLQDLYISQLRWATSALLEESTIHPRYKHDKWLRFFTQEIPDNYFLMYKPVFYMKKAPIDLDIILISPSELILVTVIEGSEHSVFEASAERFWIEYVDKTRKKRLSPLLSMKRMSGIIEWIMEQHGLAYPIRKIVISPNSLIDNKVAGIDTLFIDKRTFETWHEQIKRQPSPLKHDQMKITARLFQYCSGQGPESDSEHEELDG